MTKQVRSGESVLAAVDVIAERLRALPQSRLQRVAPHAHVFAQWLADAAAGVDCRAAPAPPTRRPLPTVGIFAVGDQVAVTGNDLVAAMVGLPAGEPVWRDGDRARLGAVLAEARARAEALRAAL